MGNKSKNLEVEIYNAVLSFNGDMECYIDTVSGLDASERFVSVCEYLQAILANVSSQLEEIIEDEPQMDLPFPTNSW